MNDINKEKDYCEQLLLNVADELNVKRVEIEKDNVFATYHYDTLTGQGKGFEGNEWTMAALLFSGNILDDMQKVRDIVANGLRQRSEARIKVRQPLSRVTIKL
jgi:hypothetical protein